MTVVRGQGWPEQQDLRPAPVPCCPACFKVVRAALGLGDGVPKSKMAGSQGSHGEPRFLQCSARQCRVPAWGSSSLSRILQIAGAGPTCCEQLPNAGAVWEISVPAAGLWQLGSGQTLVPSQVWRGPGSELGGTGRSWAWAGSAWVFCVASLEAFSEGGEKAAPFPLQTLGPSLPL